MSAPYDSKAGDTVWVGPLKVVDGDPRVGTIWVCEEHSSSPGLLFNKHPIGRYTLHTRAPLTDDELAAVRRLLEVYKAAEEALRHVNPDIFDEGVQAFEVTAWALQALNDKCASVMDAHDDRRIDALLGATP